MDIFLSLNNREKVIKLPHLPPEFTISSPQGNETYQTVNGELNLIGNIGLKGLTFSSFFDNWDTVYVLEDLRKKKLPFRFIVTETGINMAVTVDNFEYGMKKGKKIYFTLTLKEFSFGGV